MPAIGGHDMAGIVMTIQTSAWGWAEVRALAVTWTLMIMMVVNLVRVAGAVVLAKAA